MKPNNLIVGMDFTELDHKLCKYVNFLATQLPIDHVNNLFVFTARDVFFDLEKTGDRGGDMLLKSIGEKMHKRFDNCFPNIQHVKNHALAGFFIEMFFFQYNKTNTDLIVMGKKEGSTGIMAKYIIRHIPAYTLIIPEKAKHKLSNIVITLDQTEHSGNMLAKALDFCSQLKDKPVVTCLHIGHLPYYSELGETISETYRHSDMADINSIYNTFFEKRKASFEKFVEEHSKGYEDIKPDIKFIAEKRTYPYLALKDYIDDEKADLLIMGTKSHTGLDSFLLGSFAEKMISINDKVPMLIVK